MNSKRLEQFLPMVNWAPEFSAPHHRTSPPVITWRHLQQQCLKWFQLKLVTTESVILIFWGKVTAWWKHQQIHKLSALYLPPLFFYVADLWRKSVSWIWTRFFFICKQTVFTSAMKDFPYIWDWKIIFQSLEVTVSCWTGGLTSRFCEVSACEPPQLLQLRVKVCLQLLVCTTEETNTK